MFKHEVNEKIGKYLLKLIEQNYDSQRAFGRVYLKLRDKQEPSEDEVTNMANRLSQIIKGNKAVQTHDLPYFSKLLGVSCEQILSAGACCSPSSLRLTNYAIACSKKPEEWESYIHHSDNPILNCDEYNKTVLDYAIEFRNYDLIKYLIEHKYIWFDDGSDKPYLRHLSAGTSIASRPTNKIDQDLFCTLNGVTFRKRLITLAIDQGDVQTLKYLHAEADKELYSSVSSAGYLSRYSFDFDTHYGEDILQHITASDEYVLDYFTDPFVIEHHSGGRVWAHEFLFLPISGLLDLLIENNSNFTEVALKKALKHNQGAYNELLRLLRLAKDDEFYKQEYTKDLWKTVCERDINFDENGNIISFWTTGICSKPNDTEGIITNVVRITRMPDSPILRHRAEEVNKLYDAIRNIGEHLDNI